MPTWRAVWRGSLARALLLTASCTTTPAAATSSCPSLTLTWLARELPGAARYELRGELFPPLVNLWERQRGQPLPTNPDGIAIFAREGQPLLIAFQQAGCLIGLLPTPPAEVWRALRDEIGPIA